MKSTHFLYSTVNTLAIKMSRCFCFLVLLFLYNHVLFYWIPVIFVVERFNICYIVHQYSIYKHEFNEIYNLICPCIFNLLHRINDIHTFPFSRHLKLRFTKSDCSKCRVLYNQSFDSSVLLHRIPKFSLRRKRLFLWYFPEWHSSIWLFLENVWRK